MVKCPNTGQLVSTGVMLSNELFEVATISDNSFTCPVCNSQHTWSKADVVSDDKKTDT